MRARLWIAGALGVLGAALLSAWGLGTLFERTALSAFDRQLVEDQLTLIGLIAPTATARSACAASCPTTATRSLYHYW